MSAELPSQAGLLPCPLSLYTKEWVQRKKYYDLGIYKCGDLDIYKYGIYLKS